MCGAWHVLCEAKRRYANESIGDERGVLTRLSEICVIGGLHRLVNGGSELHLYAIVVILLHIVLGLHSVMLNSSVTITHLLRPGQKAMTICLFVAHQ